MKVAIFCGGRGTRFREVSDVIPKPMAPIGNRPILWHIMKIYSHWGYNDFVLLLGYKGTSIREFFLNFAAYTNDVTVDLGRNDAERLVFHTKSAVEPWRITLVDTGEDAMTGAAALARAEASAGRGDVCGDSTGTAWGTSTFRRCSSLHQGHGKAATLTGVHPPGRFGELVTKDSAITKFNEKPRFSGGYLNGGLFLAFNDSDVRPLPERPEDLILEPASRCSGWLEDGELDDDTQHDDYWHQHGHAV